MCRNPEDLLLFILLFCLNWIPSRHQITRAADSSSTQEPPAPLPSPGRRSVPTKPLASTDAFRAAGGETGGPQNQRADAETVAAEPSGQPDAPCSRAAGPRIEVRNQLRNKSQHLHSDTQKKKKTLFECLFKTLWIEVWTTFFRLHSVIVVKNNRAYLSASETCPPWPGGGGFTCFLEGSFRPTDWNPGALENELEHFLKIVK